MATWPFGMTRQDNTVLVVEPEQSLACCQSRWQRWSTAGWLGQMGDMVLTIYPRGNLPVLQISSLATLWQFYCVKLSIQIRE